MKLFVTLMYPKPQPCSWI